MDALQPWVGTAAVRDAAKGHRRSLSCRRDALTDELHGFAVALLLHLLEELVAGIGAGQEETETLRREPRSHTSYYFIPLSC